MKKLISSKSLKTTAAIALSLLMLGLGLEFLSREGVNLPLVSKALGQVPPQWLYLGLLLTVAYVWFHAKMYQQSFRALGLTVSTATMARLYLKRNFISVFLPAGFISSQAFFSKEIERQEKVSEFQVLAASSLFASAGLISMLMLGFPVLGWLLTQHVLPEGAVVAFLLLSALFLLIVWAAWSLIRGGFLYQWSQKNWPVLSHWVDAHNWPQLEWRFFIQAILWSCLVEAAGILHVYIAARAFGVEATWAMALAGYTAVLIVLLSSPFLRGVGAVEALLSLVLIRFGLAPVAAVSAAVLFRFFEFWVVLLMAVPVFLVRPNSLWVRVAPAALLFVLGLVGIFSALTPAWPERIHLLSNYLPLQAIHASMAFSVCFGFLLLVTAFYLLGGSRMAWGVALGLSLVALLVHLTKGFDYEEALLAFMTITVLLYQRKNYRVRSDLRRIQHRWVLAAIVLSSILVLTALGFYELDHHHFGADFTWLESINFALRNFLLLNSTGLKPLTLFGAEFLGMVHLLGGLSWLLLAYALFHPLLFRFEVQAEERAKALELVARYGNSTLDYFKTYRDKQFYFTQNQEAFVAYKNTARYALVLENPVAADEITLQKSVGEFDQFCQRNGLNSIYYRIPETSVALYRNMGKSLLALGEEARVNLTTFSLEGKDHRTLRNTVSKMERERFFFKVYEAPLNKRFLQQLRAVSDEWLKMYERDEIGFSQGVFDENELKNQTILSIEDAEGKIFAFVNLIPGANGKEARFDLMRRTQDAPNGTMDFMFVNMLKYLKSQGYQYCNLGLVPMSGLQHPTNLPERLINLAYQRLPQFATYKSLRFFKEKFKPEWEMTYVAYDQQLDLVNLPRVLQKAIRA